MHQENRAWRTSSAAQAQQLLLRESLAGCLAPDLPHWMWVKVPWRGSKERAGTLKGRHRNFP